MKTDVLWYGGFSKYINDVVVFHLKMALGAETCSEQRE
jgi:hypothetical protein